MSRAFHFLKQDMTAGKGEEPPWVVGEERTWDGPIKLCESGYHSSPIWLAALEYAPDFMACLVEVSEPMEKDDSKQVSRTRKLIAAKYAKKEILAWACDCAERALQSERRAGREPDTRSWEAIMQTRAYLAGTITKEELAEAAEAAGAAWVAARDARAARAARAARDAAWAARDAARDARAAAEAAWAARDAAEAAWAVRDAARDARAARAARDAEREWQSRHLDELLTPLFGGS